MWSSGHFSHKTLKEVSKIGSGTLAAVAAVAAAAAAAAADIASYIQATKNQGTIFKCSVDGKSD